MLPRNIGTSRFIYLVGVTSGVDARDEMPYMFFSVRDVGLSVFVSYTDKTEPSRGSHHYFKYIYCRISNGTESRSDLNTLNCLLASRSRGNLIPYLSLAYKGSIIK